MQRPADASLGDQRICLHKDLRFFPTGGPKQQHAASPIATAADPIGPITAAGLMALALQLCQPGQVGWDHRVELGLGNQTLLKLHKGRAHLPNPLGAALPAAPFGAIAHLIPHILPLAPPLKRPLTDGADFGGAVLVVRHLQGLDADQRWET